MEFEQYSRRRTGILGELGEHIIACNFEGMQLYDKKYHQKVSGKHPKLGRVHIICRLPGKYEDKNREPKLVQVSRIDFNHFIFGLFDDYYSLTQLRVLSSSQFVKLASKQGGRYRVTVKQILEQAETDIVVNPSGCG